MHFMGNTQVFACPELFVGWLKLTDACAGVFGNWVVQYAENRTQLGNLYEFQKWLPNIRTDTVWQRRCIVVLPGHRRWANCLMVALPHHRLFKQSVESLPVEACVPRFHSWGLQWNFMSQMDLKRYPDHIVCNVHTTKHRKNCECCPVSLLNVRSQRLSWIQVLNCQNCNQCLKGHSLSKLSKIVKIVRNCQ